jgi:hypothetical protein
MSIIKNAILDGINLVNRDSETNAVLSEDTIELKSINGSLVVGDIFVGEGMIPSLEHPNVPTTPSNDTISLYYDSTNCFIS